MRRLRGVARLGLARLGLAVAMLAGCSGDLIPVRGTTTRVAQPESVPDLDLELKIFTNRADCLGAGVDEADLDQCVPRVDRASGEVQLGYQFRLNGEEYPLPPFKEHLQVSHQRRLVQDGVGGQAYTVIPHKPYPVRQLYVVVVDGSSSMAEHNRMRKVRQALLLDDVKDAFFPDGVKTGVVLLEFTSGNPEPVGGRLEILENRRQYVKRVKQLSVRQGFTHLYDAVTYATGPLLKEPVIAEALELNEMAVTVVVLTDGFNNLSSRDTCGDNAERLTLLLKHLDTVRGEGADLRRRPTVYTVGLGRPVRPRYTLPDDRPSKITPVQLCGRRFKDRRIDGELENRGIDNASLMLIADRGGGSAYIRQDRDGLGEAFKAAAARRYAWFELRYRVDPFYLRRSFRTQLRLLSFATAQASIMIHPSAWLDGPPGRRAEDGWTRPRPFTHTLTVLTPAIGLLIGLSYLNAAWFNTRRALFGRLKVRRRRKGGGGGAAGSSG